MKNNKKKSREFSDREHALLSVLLLLILVVIFVIMGYTRLEVQTTNTIVELSKRLELEEECRRYVKISGYFGDDHKRWYDKAILQDLCYIDPFSEECPCGLLERE